MISASCGPTLRNILANVTRITMTTSTNKPAMTQTLEKSNIVDLPFSSDRTVCVVRQSEKLFPAMQRLLRELVPLLHIGDSHLRSAR